MSLEPEEQFELNENLPDIPSSYPWETSGIEPFNAAAPPEGYVPIDGEGCEVTTDELLHILIEALGVNELALWRAAELLQAGENYSKELSDVRESIRTALE